MLPVDVGVEAVSGVEGCDADGTGAVFPLDAPAVVDGGAELAPDAVPLDPVPGDEAEAAVVEGAEDVWC